MAVAIAALCALGGCAGAQDAAIEEEPLAQAAPWVVPTVSDGGVPLPLKVEVTATGTGCPPGSWWAESDGESLRVRFAQYEAPPPAGSPLTRSWCTIRVRAPVQAARSYALRSVSFRGYARLEPGARAYVTLRHYLVGLPRFPERKLRVDLEGPVDGPFDSLDDTPESVVWGFCDYPAHFAIATQIQVQEQEERTSPGSVTLASFGEARGEVAWRLVSRPCPAVGQDAGTAVAPASGIDAGALDAAAP